MSEDGEATVGEATVDGAPPPMRQMRALFDDESLTVYQAYSPQIADRALAAGRFVSPFKIHRMTWVKPSFLWMMYRSGWATKPMQERVLAVRIARAGFDEALTKACLTHFDPALHSSHDAWKAQRDASPVRVQWDPERTLDLQPLPWRSIQVGLSGPVVRDYVRRWPLGITDVTALAHEVHALVDAGRPDQASELLPRERAYPLPRPAAVAVGADSA